MDNTEQALLSILCQDGIGSYHEAVSLGITEHSFLENTHKVIFKCLKVLFDDGIGAPDPLMIIHCAEDLKYSNFDDNASYLDQLFKNNVKQENLKPFGQKIRKLEIARLMDTALKEARSELSDIQGTESIGEICSIIEDKMANIFSFVNTSGNEPTAFADIIDEFLQSKIDNPVTQMGIPTGFPIWDQAIGGGLRRHAIQLIGGRSKAGKSVFSKQVGINVAKQGIPVLYLDTEMQTEDQLMRILASESGVSIKDIETGQFAKNKDQYKKIIQAKITLKQISRNFKHKVIAGEPFENHLAIMRRWLIKDVGLNKDGTAKDCLVIYDYFKLMDSGDMKNMQEYQAIGFMLSSLHNFTVKYDIPLLASVQLNRDGQGREDSAVISQSDRIAWLCSSFSILKFKTDGEAAEEGYSDGNQKLIPVLARYGPCLDAGDYININFDKNIVRMEEKGTKSNKQQRKKTDKQAQDETGFAVTNIDEQVKF